MPRPASWRMAVYESSIYRQSSDTYYRMDFDNNGCARRLVAIYMREDRPRTRAASWSTS